MSSPLPEQTGSVGELARDPLGAAVARATAGVLGDQAADGFWCYEFEADCTIPAEYVLLAHFTGETQFTSDLAPDLEARIGNYLRRRQLPGGGWALYPGGRVDLSCSVKAYYALKLLGDDPDAPHMARAREVIRAGGGAFAVNVFTRITLALFGQLSWRVVPVVPVELMLLPRWAPVHLEKVAYWSRAVTVPLSVLCSLRTGASNPTGIGVQELFVRDPESEPRRLPARSVLNRVFIALDRIARWLEPRVPRRLHALALRRAERWIVERLNGVDGLGAIFPAMANAYEALGALGYTPAHPYRRQGAEALKRLLVAHLDEVYCQPCLSPMWDTGLACLALGEVREPGSGEPDRQCGGDPRIARRLADTALIPLGAPRAPGEVIAGAVDEPPDPREALPPGDAGRAVRSALDWLVTRQLLDEPGDWRAIRPRLRGGGWPFEFGNGHYPDIDDTAVVGWAMQRFAPARYARSIARAAEWVAGMQSSNGGFAAFDADNTFLYLNQVPFADHGALLDPPTSDVTARCIAFLSLVDRERYASTIQRAVGFLRREQEPEGCWFGRWGTNYIYGTWSVLAAMELAGQAGGSWLERGADWLEACQRPDGGWGETNDSYDDRRLMGRSDTSTSFQTAWAMLGLIAAGRAGARAVGAGADYLCRTQREDGLWYDEAFTCPGFPRVFYIKYHGYSKYFPLWALARYHRALGANRPRGAGG